MSPLPWPRRRARRTADDLDATERRLADVRADRDRLAAAADRIAAELRAAGHLVSTDLGNDVGLALAVERGRARMAAAFLDDQPLTRRCEVCGWTEHASGPGADRWIAPDLCARCAPTGVLESVLAPDAAWCTADLDGDVCALPARHRAPCRPAGRRATPDPEQARTLAAAYGVRTHPDRGVLR